MKGKEHDEHKEGNHEREGTFHPADTAPLLNEPAGRGCCKIRQDDEECRDERENAMAPSSQIRNSFVTSSAHSFHAAHLSVSSLSVWAHCKSRQSILLQVAQVPPLSSLSTLLPLPLSSLAHLLNFFCLSAPNKRNAAAKVSSLHLCSFSVI